MAFKARNGAATPREKCSFYRSCGAGRVCESLEPLRPSRVPRGDSLPESKVKLGTQTKELLRDSHDDLV